MTTERKVTVGFVIGLGFMVALGGAACWNGWHLFQNARSLDHTYEVLRGIEDLHIQLHRLESQTRGYALGEADAALEESGRGKEAVLARLEDLRVLVYDSASQTERLRQLAPVIRQKIAFMDSMVEARRHGSGSALEALAAGGEGARLMRECVDLILAFEQEERDLLSTLNTRALIGGVRTFSVVLCGWLIAFAWAVLSGISIHRDLSARRRVERALQESNDASALINAQLTASNKQLESFSYSVSHDLRVPLRAIDGYSRMLLEDYGPALDAEGQRLVGVVRSSTKDMGQLIDDLLEFSRLGRQPLTMQPVEMEAIAQQAWNELQESSPGSAITIRIDALPPARGDSAMLRQVMLNLLSNAVKFTRDVATPQITVGARTENGVCTYFVRDNGCGFDMRHAGKLFEVFQRLHRKEEFEGSGVGLALVQNVVHRHGGTIWAESEPDKGATFYFTLPAIGNTPSRRVATVHAMKSRK